MTNQTTEKQPISIDENEGKTPTFTMPTDRGTYIVTIHFSQTSKETLEEKVRKMIWREAVGGVGG